MDVPADIIELQEENILADDDTVFDDLIEECSTIDGLKMLSKTKIDNEKGFYLVQYEDTSVIIGYIYDNIFVIKELNELIVRNIQYKFAEQLSSTTSRYILKIGTYKMVVDVSDTKIEHVIDL